MHLTLELAASD